MRMLSGALLSCKLEQALFGCCCCLVIVVVVVVVVVVFVVKFISFLITTNGTALTKRWKQKQQKCFQTKCHFLEITSLWLKGLVRKVLLMP